MPVKNSQSKSRSEWVVIHVALGTSEAYLFANRLKSEGLPAFVHQESLASVIGITMGIGEICVLVHENDYDEAAAILDLDEVEQLPSDTDYIIVDNKQDDELT